jgi:hypothetical protein
MKTLILLICAALAAQAQSAAGGGSIQGTVKDSTGSANTTANHEGYFATPTLAIGKYKLRVEAAGMKAWEEQVTLETGRTVEITPSSPPATTEPTDASTLDSQRIKELPINGRDLNTLLGQVAPSVEQVIDVSVPADSWSTPTASCRTARPPITANSAAASGRNRTGSEWPASPCPQRTRRASK